MNSFHILAPAAQELLIWSHSIFAASPWAFPSLVNYPWLPIYQPPLLLLNEIRKILDVAEPDYILCQVDLLVGSTHEQGGVAARASCCFVPFICVARCGAGRRMFKANHCRSSLYNSHLDFQFRCERLRLAHSAGSRTGSCYRRVSDLQDAVHRWRRHPRIPCLGQVGACMYAIWDAGYHTRLVPRERENEASASRWCSGFVWGQAHCCKGSLLVVSCY